MKEKDTAKSQARAQIDTLCEMMETYEATQEEGSALYEGQRVEREDMEEIIEGDALSVEVRSDWHTPGQEEEAIEFSILLCTGGPAVRIVGNLGQHNTPETAVVQYQDWFTKWENYTETTEEEDEMILDYCNMHYFGE